MLSRRYVMFPKRYHVKTPENAVTVYLVKAFQMPNIPISMRIFQGFEEGKKFFDEWKPPFKGSFFLSITKMYRIPNENDLYEVKELGHHYHAFRRIKEV